jgi:hypothetical protein
MSRHFIHGILSVHLGRPGKATTASYRKKERRGTDLMAFGGESARYTKRFAIRTEEPACRLVRSGFYCICKGKRMANRERAD